MEAYQERVVAERKDLEEKLERLTLFISTTRFEDLYPDERTRLMRQRDAMRDYSSILQERIEAFAPQGEHQPQPRPHSTGAQQQNMA